MIRSAEVAKYLNLPNRVILKWIQSGYIRSTRDDGNQRYRHSLPIAEATVAELMTLIMETGLDAPHAAPIAHYMMSHGPTRTNGLFSWRAPLTSNVVITLTTQYPIHPLARPRDSD